MKNLNYLIKTMRPAQWIKNLLVLAGLVFAEKIGDLHLSWLALQAFLVFCMLSSAVYLINDVLDRERDREHPLKKERPVASGKLSPGLCTLTAMILALAAAAWAMRLGRQFSIVGVSYLVLNILFTVKLKHVVIVDVMTIALGFLLRVLAGTVVINVETSHWILICTFLLSLFLGFGKRRHELILLESEASTHRDVLVHYSPYFLDQMISVVTPSTLICYTLYTLSGDTVAHVGSRNLLFSVPFVMYGIFRYLYLIHERIGGGDPTHLLLTDLSLLGAVVFWLAVVGIVLYL